MMSLLNLVRPKKVKPVPPPPPPSPAPLPGKLFADLVGLDAMRTRRPADRRRRPRLDRSGALTIVAELQPAQPALGVHVHDMSAEGISFDAPIAIPLGTQFSAKMERVSGDGIVDLTYTVRRCDA